MKKAAIAISLMVLLILTTIILTGCNKDENVEIRNKSYENVGTKILTIEVSEDEFFQSKIDYLKDGDIKIIDDEEDESHVRFENEKKNYSLDIYLGDELTSTFKESQEDAESKEGYVEDEYGTELGSFFGYYDKSNAVSLDGNIVLEDETYNETMYLHFILEYLENPDKIENDGLEKIYNSEDVKTILNSIAYRYEQNNEEDVED